MDQCSPYIIPDDAILCGGSCHVMLERVSLDLTKRVCNSESIQVTRILGASKGAA